MATQPKTIEQALSDFRAEQDRQRQAAEAKVEAERQARLRREAETAQRAIVWLEREYGVSVPVDQIECSEQDAGYQLEISAIAGGGRVRLNGLLSWTDDNSLAVTAKLGKVPGEPSWHGSTKGAYIDASFLNALDFAFPWPATELQGDAILVGERQ